MAWPFKRKQAAIVPQLLPALRPLDESDDDLALALSASGTRQAAAFAKGMDYDFYGGAYGANDNGGYYGSEFDIVSSPARIKACYAKEPWIYTGATHIARSLVSVPLKVYDQTGEKELPSHPLNALLKSGTPVQSDIEKDWCSYLDLALGGNAFILLEPGGKRIAGMAPIECTTPEMRADGVGLRGITVTQIGSSSATQGRFFPIEDVVHLKTPNPYSPFFGMSIFLAAARPLLQDRYKNEYDMAFYLRGAMTPGVIEATEDLSQSRLKRLMLTFEQSFTGKSNWWRTLFLPKGSKWVSSGLTMTEMQHLESLKENRKTILAVIGIPGSLVGLVEDVNRATAEQQERVFWSNTVIPTAKFIAAGWTNSHLVKVIYGGKVMVKPDFSGIEAVEGFASIRKERADAMAPYFYIDEVREKIWKAQPLPNGAGQRFAAEVRAALPAGGGGELQLTTAPAASVPAVTETAPTFDLKAARKAAATGSQNRIEEKLGVALERAVNAYVEELLDDVVAAIDGRRDLAAYLDSHAETRLNAYMQRAAGTYASAMERGFSAAASQVKTFTASEKRVTSGFPGLSENDREAVEVLRERGRDGRRRVLEQRAIERFRGFDSSRTDAIVGLVAEGHAEGQSFEEISRGIRDVYKERYRNQSRTIVRTEILSAVSEGLAWNHDVLGQVFSDVQKEWIHQGDGGINPDAREEHVDFEARGPIPGAAVWEASDGTALAYPRDPAGGPAQVINCRCSMISVIPESATSNADAILETT